jgi:hypothetical protein
MARRLDLYRDRPGRHIAQAIDQVYETAEMKDTLRRYIDVAKEENVSARIIGEVASLYDRPALRTLSKRNEEFHAEEKRIGLHFIHQEAHRLTNLCNEVLVWQFKGADDKPKLRIITPDCFDAIPDTRDKLVPAGYLIDAAPSYAHTPEQAKKLPNYELWDDKYRYLINAYGRIVDEYGEPGQPWEHGLNRIPGVLFHRREPTEAILDGDSGEDIASGHVSVALLNVMVMRLSKAQGENQPVLQGNLAQMASGQVMNGERPLLLPPEVVASMLSMKTDPDHYLAVKKDKVTSVCLRYGISYEQYANSETEMSGKAFQQRREKLIKICLEQRGRAVVHEEMVAELMGFDPSTIKADFQEQTLPQDANEEVDLLDSKMRKGLDSPVSFLMRKDPDLTRDDAVTLLKANLTDFAALVMWQRALNAPADADAAKPGKTPQENGAANEEKQPGESDAPQGNEEGGDVSKGASPDDEAA